MQLGDSYTWVPTAFFATEAPREAGREKRYLIQARITGKVIYIHPEGRYFTVEARLDGGIIRESFQMKK